MDSILTSIKKLLGLNEDDDSFDTDIIMHINSALMVLTQLGVGSPNGFYISDDSAVWSDFTSDEHKIEGIKSYVYMKVRLMFDPPSNSFVTESFNRMINEFEWRINVNVDPPSN